MRKLLISTTALSVAISPMGTMPIYAQVLNEDGSVTGPDGTVICAPTADTACDLDAIVLQLQAEAEAAAQAQAEAEAAAQAQAEAEAAAAAEAEAAAQAEAEAQAAADAAAAAEAEAAAQAEADAAAAAEADAAAQVEADAAAQAEADAAQAEADAAAQAEADAAAQAEAEAAAQAEAEAAAAAEAPVTEEPATEDVVVEEPAAEEPATDAAAAEELVTDGVIDTATGEVVDAETAAQALQAAEEELAISETGEIVDPAAGLRVAEPATTEEVEPVDAPVVSEAEVETLTELLTADPTAIDPSSLAAAEVLAATPETTEGEPVTIAPAPAEMVASVIEETVTEESVRTSAEEFAAAPRALGDGKKSGLSDLEKAGLLVLGALAVGAIIKNNNEARAQQESRVVSNTGDRVVVLQPDGTYRVLKDDDTVIRRPGSTVRTETFRDGSTRTIVERADGTQVVTIRDATGRVLRRATYDDLGREIVLINDLEPEEAVVIRDLPRPERRIVISSSDNDAALKRELAALEAERAGRKFSLRQIREIPQVRALAAVIDVENITFASGSSAIAAAEARNLADLGRVMQDLLEENPREVFLIEGHTDATGKAAMNLALSDRRAESVALALTEYFDIPPENMVVQGYGETELLIDTQASEPANRRVEVRVITPLLRTAAVR